mmetsp:Transcript_24041/g.51116  ORF Transcript_24041/g.51116 Transcript_24041/m.51116 type:complete len:201 (+) Transcript_24041:618-1220(+)
MEELTAVRIERKTVHPVSVCQDQDGRGRKQAVAGHHQRSSVLQKGGVVDGGSGLVLVDTEDAAHGQTGIDVFRSVDGIEDSNVISHGKGGIRHDIRTTPRLVFLFGCHRMDAGRPAAAECPQHDGVAQDVQLLLHLALDVVLEGCPVFSQCHTVQIVCLGSLHDFVDLFAGLRHRLQHGCQVSEFPVPPGFDLEVSLKGF